MLGLHRLFCRFWGRESLVLAELNGHAVGIVHIEVFRRGFGIADGGGIQSCLGHGSVDSFQIVGGKAEEHSFALEGLTFRHGDDLDLGLTLGILEIGNIAAVCGELLGDSQPGKGGVKAEGSVKIGDAEGDVVEFHVVSPFV